MGVGSRVAPRLTLSRNGNGRTAVGRQIRDGAVRWITAAGKDNDLVNGAVIMKSQENRKIQAPITNHGYGGFNATDIGPRQGAVNGPLSVRFLLFRREAHLPSSSFLDPLTPLSATASSSQSLPGTPIPSNNKQQQKQEINVSVLRFTLGIPGLDESYLPRYLRIALGTLIVINHVFSAAPATPSQLRTEALGIFLATFSVVLLPYLRRFLEGAIVDCTSLPKGNRQLFLMSNNISDDLKEDMSWVMGLLCSFTQHE
ncbi:uncharacterized protein LOC121979762 [Zingiber officinale]|uniref:uncharacterized protein LOC121979762 n=1 Tax=Zingiber officinale TaxID=94328 RepID=UPI001C4D2637|nr:uncharacterized protein LOC121979762 [Zingiber officinale]